MEFNMLIDGGQEAERDKTQDKNETIKDMAAR
jgi:hypothetical protein